jgi:Zinc carboxypeptidase
MTSSPYTGDAYLDWPAVERFCQELAASHPDLVRLESIGDSRMGRPIWMLTIGTGQDLDGRPAFWLDGGTHAAEWTGVMACLYAASRWVEGVKAGDPELAAWFGRHVAHIVPCISPDGFQALHEGTPFLRSTVRPPRQTDIRSGLDPQDIDGDGEVRWMRWRHPAGPWVHDPELPVMMRPRTVDDDPADAWFLCDEGLLLNWDGVRWTAATLRHGLDLNRNFPGHWAPFEMFGMDGGAFPGSEPESRATVDAVAARPRIGAALTNHTYTGALLTQPYRKDGPVGEADISLMERMAEAAVEGTGYDVYRVWPSFTYDEKKAIVGVWADTLSSVFGLPGYTLELWNPLSVIGEKLSNPAQFFRKPDVGVLRRVVQAHVAQGAAVAAWTPFDHPQLGPVEIGGLDYMRTIRNPPVALLAAECEKGLRVADRLRRSLPRVEVRLTERVEGGRRHIELVAENLGFLPSSALRRAEEIGSAPRVQAALRAPGCRRVEGPEVADLGYLDGWGSMQVADARHPIYPALPARGHRAVARWVVEGAGAITVEWDAGRGGSGVVRVGG